MPASTRSSVDLPLPDGPRINTESPARTCSTTSSNSTVRSGKVMVRAAVFRSVGVGSSALGGCTTANEMARRVSIWVKNTLKRWVVADQDAKRL